jgi:putative endonuclease
MNKYDKKRMLGKFGEELATDYLVKNGYLIVENNYRCFSGEIDIIAKKKDLLIIVEVKSRSKIGSEETLFSITKSKQRKISRAAADFIEKNQQYSEYYIRFDVITVVKSRQGEDYIINHYDDAFCYLF